MDYMIINYNGQKVIIWEASKEFVGFAEGIQKISQCVFKRMA